MTPYNTGKVRIGETYNPKRSYVTPEGEAIQRALLPHRLRTRHPKRIHLRRYLRCVRWLHNHRDAAVLLVATLAVLVVLKLNL